MNYQRRLFSAALWFATGLMLASDANSVHWIFPMISFWISGFMGCDGLRRYIALQGVSANNKWAGVR